MFQQLHFIFTRVSFDLKQRDKYAKKKKIQNTTKKNTEKRNQQGGKRFVTALYTKLCAQM